MTKAHEVAGFFFRLNLLGVSPIFSKFPRPTKTVHYKIKLSLNENHQEYNVLIHDKKQVENNTLKQ
jgi:hypothetical protein